MDNKERFTGFTAREQGLLLQGLGLAIDLAESEDATADLNGLRALREELGNSDWQPHPAKTAPHGFEKT